jgi:hypothetical protein
VLISVQLGQPAPTGAAAATISVSIGASTSGYSTVTGSAASGQKISTTTKNGVASVVTSLLGDITSHSDSNRVRPIVAGQSGFSFITVYTFISVIIGMVAFTAKLM